MFTHKIIKNFLTVEECDSILKFSKTNLSLAKASVGGMVGHVNESVRKSKISFYKYETEFPYLKTKILTEIKNNIEVKGYNIEFTEPFQFTEYKKNQYYNWHTDSSSDMNNRYCSIVIQLNDSYIGGELELMKNEQIEELEKGKGNLFIFLSNITHRVKPVTKGTRYSLVNWFGIKKIEGYKKTLI